MPSSINRLIVACQTSGGGETLYYLSDNPRSRYGGCKLSRFNTEAIAFVSLDKLTPDLIGTFNEIAEDIGLGSIDWTQLRVIEITNTCSETVSLYDATTRVRQPPAPKGHDDDAITTLAAQCRAGFDSPAGIRLDMLTQVAEALEQLRDTRANLQARLRDATATQGRPHTPPMWLAAAPPECPAH